jgi:crotonobetainyl-CoA:carnitine CoA-transferase CaiB-like acyl-CoA transferase
VSGSARPDDGLLAGIRVLDLSIWRPGPYATQLLADLGADVLKVEPPGGDPMRIFPELFATLNANKRSVVLDLHAAGDRAVAHRLVADADALVEGFRPGVAARLGMGEPEVRAINPALVYTSVSGFGQTGPLATAPGHDLNYQAYAGVLAPGGGAPVACAVPIADLAGGIVAAMATCAALLGRVRTGEGEHVDVAMTDVLATWTGPIEHLAVAGSDEPMPGLPTYGSFATADGAWVTLGVIDEQHFWAHVCDGLGLDDLRDLTMLERVARHADISPRLTDAIAARTRDELVALLGEKAPVAPVLSRAEMLHHPQFEHRHLVGGSTPAGYPAMGYPARLGVRPARGPGRAPTLGEHQDEGFEPRSRDAGRPVS